MPSRSWRFFLRKGQAVSLKSEIVTTGIAVAVGRVGGLVIPIALAATYGVSRQTDIFFVVWGIMLAFIMIAGHLFETVLVPHLSRALTGNDGRTVDVMVSAVLKTATIPLLIFVGFCSVSIRPVFEFVSGWAYQDIAFASRLFWLMAPIPLFAMVASVCLGALNASGSYAWGAMSPLCRTAPPALFLAVTRGNSEITGLALSYVLGEFLRALLAIVGYYLAGYRLVFNSYSSRFSRATLQAAWQQVLGFAGICLFPIVTHMQASSLGVGEVSILAYAQHMRNIPQLLLMTAFGTVLLTDWSALRSRSEASRVVYRDLFNAVIWTTCCTIIMLVISYPLTWVVLVREAIPEESVVQFWRLFALLALSLPFDVLGFLAARFLIVSERHRTFVFLAYVRLLVVFVFNLALLQQFGIEGVGISVLMANAVYSAVVVLAVWQRLKGSRNHLDEGAHCAVSPLKETSC